MRQTYEHIYQYLLIYSTKPEVIASCLDKASAFRINTRIDQFVELNSSCGGVLKAVRKTFSKNMKRLRKKNGFSQEDLAEKLDVSVRYIQQLEGKNCPSVGLDVVAKLARALKSTPRDFFED